MEHKACSTCKDRKISCDRTGPVCQNCIRSKRLCRRYNIRLSWPRENDRRRTVLGDSNLYFQSKGMHTQFKFINTTSRDVELHGYLLDPAVLHTQLPQYIGAYVLAPTPSLSNDPSSEHGKVELVPYFFSVVLPSIPAFGIDLEKLRGVIMRLAIFDDSAPSQAVLNSLLALAALYKFGNTKQATRFVLAALTSLKVSVQKGIELQQGLQHIIAGMLICSFEIHLFSQSSSLWLLYLSGTKAIINRLYQRRWSEDEDQSILFQWVFYYDTLARLGIKHSRGRRSLQSQLEKEVGFGKGNLGDTTDEITKFAKFGHKALELLSELSVGILSPDDPRYRSIEYICWLDEIEKQLSSIRRELQQNRSLHDLDNQSESVAIKELFVLATLLYSERKSKQLAGQSCKTDEWIEEAFVIFLKIERCNKLFPLFMFGCEARSDSRRLLILEIIDRTMEATNTCSLALLREVLVKLWVQDDLDVEGDANYQTRVCVSDFVLCLL